MDIWTELNSCLTSVRRRTDFVPELALVLGSGLGGFAEELDLACAVPYADIEGFPVSTVAGHQGRFLFGTLEGVRLVVMQGRVHYYEGYTMQQVVLPIRLTKLLGAKTLFLTNAAGAVNETYSPGDLMMIRGHISSFVPSPLIGTNPEQLGTRFPDMSSVYDPVLCEAIRKAAATTQVPLHSGIYLQTTGPQFETPEEVSLYGRLGADAVGMSTAVEAIAARHAGMRVCGISLLSNMAAGLSAQPLTHEEVQVTAAQSSARFTKLLRTAIPLVAEAGRLQTL